MEQEIKHLKDLSKKLDNDKKRSKVKTEDLKKSIETKLSEMNSNKPIHK